MAAPESNVEINAVDRMPECTDYSQARCAAPRYRWRKIRPDGNVVPILQLNATVDAVFRFGSGFNINFARSRLCYTEQFPNGSANAANCRLMPKLIPGIEKIRMQTSTGTVLIDVPDFQAHFLLVRDWNISVTEWTTRATMASMALSADGCSGFAHDQALASAYNYSLPQYARRLTGVFCTSSTANGGAGQLFPAPGAATVPTFAGLTAVPLRTCGFTQIREDASFGPVTTDWCQAAANGQATVLCWDLRFRDLMPHTIAVIDQDMFFGADLSLTITHSQGADRVLVFETTGGNGIQEASKANMFDYVAGQGPSVAGQTSSVGAALANNEGTAIICRAGAAGELPTILASSYCIQLACQDNSELVNVVREEIMGPGLAIPVQVYMLTKDATGWYTFNAAQQTYSKVQRVNLSRGMAILRMYTAIAVLNPHGVATVSADAAVKTIQTSASIAPIAYNLNVDDPAASRNVYPWTWGACKWTGYRSYFNTLATSDSLLDPFEAFSRMRDMIRKCEYWPRTFESWGCSGGVVIEDFIDGYPLHNNVKNTPLGGMSLVNPVEIMTEIQSGANLYATSLASTVAAGTSVGGYALVQEIVFSKIFRLGIAGISLESA